MGRGVGSKALKKTNVVSHNSADLLEQMGNNHTVNEMLKGDLVSSRLMKPYETIVNYQIVRGSGNIYIFTVESPRGKQRYVHFSVPNFEK